MAKQSGLHQIRGKVGEHSYYRQTGISSGLIRSINQGMSERVKTAEEYANTRLNNTEFGAACNVAGLLGKMVVPKFRPMILPFSQSNMARALLELARQNSNNWGQRVVSSSQTSLIAAILSLQSKRDFTEFVSVSAERPSASQLNIIAAYSSDQATLMKSLGIDYITVSAVQYDLATGQWNPIAQVMTTGYFYKRDSVNPFEESEILSGEGLSTTEDMTISAFVPESNHAGHQLLVFVFIPIRKIGTGYHVLQEYCSFSCIEAPAYNG